jgi:hypothetical protein
LRVGLTVISTSCPSAIKKSIGRSIENLSRVNRGICRIMKQKRRRGMRGPGVFARRVYCAYCTAKLVVAFPDIPLIVPTAFAW